jgi:phospholipid-translocating ATPase
MYLLFSRLQLIAAAGMVPILAIKYFRYAYKPSKINTLQQAERLGDQYRLLGRSSDNNEWSWKMLLEYQLLNPRT